MSLSKQVIVDSAIHVLNREGFAKLSMRKIGAELGVEAMSLYNHVKNKTALLDGIHARLLERLGLPDEDSDWKEASLQMARNFRDILKNNPAAIPLFASRSAIAQGSVEALDRCIGILLEAGFQPLTAMQIFQSLFGYVLGHCQFYYSPREANSYSSPEMYASFPNLAKVPPMQTYKPDDEFEFGLESFLNGAERALGRGIN